MEISGGRRGGDVSATGVCVYRGGPLAFLDRGRPGGGNAKQTQQRSRPLRPSSRRGGSLCGFCPAGVIGAQPPLGSTDFTRPASRRPGYRYLRRQEGNRAARRAGASSAVDLRAQHGAPAVAGQGGAGSQRYHTTVGAINAPCRSARRRQPILVQQFNSAQATSTGCPPTLPK